MGCPKKKKTLVILSMGVSGLIFIGCATHLTLRPAVEVQTRPVKLNQRIGIYYSAALQNYHYVADPYGNMHAVHFPVGTASVSLLDKTFAQLFEHRQLVDNLFFGNGRSRNLDAIIAPEIKEFAYYSRRAGGWHYWAKITYGFTVYSAGGDRIAEWEVSGSGTSRYEGGFNEKDCWAQAAERAMADAVEQFRSGFAVIPEAIRWVRNLPVDSSLIDIDIRADQQSMDSQERKLIYFLKDIVEVTVARNPDVTLQLTERSNQLAAEGLWMLAVDVRNQSSDEVCLLASDIRLQTAAEAAVGPIPANFFSALAVTDHVRLPSVATGTQWGATANLLFALANASALVDESAQRVELADKLTPELQNSRLGKGGSASGGLFFAGPPTRHHENTELMVPLSIPSRAIRYRLWLPVRVADGE